MINLMNLKLPKSSVKLNIAGEWLLLCSIPPPYVFIHRPKSVQYLINHFWPMFLFSSLENVRKPLIFWYIQGVKNGNIDQEWFEPLMTKAPIIGDALHDLIPIVLFEKHKKHPWKGVMEECYFY